MKIFFIVAIACTDCFVVNAQNVGIGTSSPEVPLHIVASLPIPAIFNGTNQMFLALLENNEYRGYIGSYSGSVPDVDFGTGASNFTGKLHLTIRAEPKLTIDGSGRVGIGTIDPIDKLHIEGGTIRIPFLAGTGNRMVRVNSLGQLQAGDILGAIVIPFNAFVKEDESTSSNVFRSTLGVAVTNGATDILYAPFYVPLGTRLTSMNVVFIDNATSNILLELVRYNHLTNSTSVVGSISTAGLASSTEARNITHNFAPNHVVDYITFGYYLRLRSINGNWAGNNLRLRSISFSFLQPNF